MRAISKNIPFSGLWKWSGSKMYPSCLLVRKGSPGSHLTLRRTRRCEHAHAHPVLTGHQIQSGWKRKLPKPGCDLCSILFQGNWRQAEFPNIPAARAQRAGRRLRATAILLISSWILKGISTLGTMDLSTHGYLSRGGKTGRTKLLPKIQPGWRNGDSDWE